MSIGKRLIEEKIDLTCSECGEAFPEYLRNMFRAQGMREAAVIIRKEDWVTIQMVDAILARAEELEGPHGEFLTK